MPIKSAAAIALEAEPPTTTWLTIKQVAERCEVSQVTVRRWISYGWVRAKRFGPKLIRIDAASVEAMADDVTWAGSQAS